MKLLTSEEKKRLKEEAIRLITDARGSADLAGRVVAGLNILVFLENLENLEATNEPGS